MGKYFNMNFTHGTQLEDKMKFIIYGTGLIGKKIYCAMKKNGCEVVVFLDRAAKKGDKIDNVPIQQKEDFFKDTEFHSKEQYIVFISLQNGNAHREIVASFLQAGFNQIIYLPMPGDVWHNEAEKVILRRAYRALAQGEISAIKLPKTILMKMNHSTVATLIQKKQKTVCTWFPVALLYTDEYGSFAQSPIVSLFRWLNSASPRIEDLGKIEKEYMVDDFQEAFLSKISFAEYIKDRGKLFNCFRDALQKEVKFFFTSAANAQLANGRFFLSDGNHRASFLYANGFQWIPVEMSQSDYDIWMNQDVIKKIIRKYKEKAINFFHWHPYTNSTVNTECSKDIVVAPYLLEYLKRYDGRKRAMVLADDLSYLSVLLYVLGFDIKCITMHQSIKEKLLDFFSLYYACAIHCWSIDDVKCLDPDADIFIVPWNFYKEVDHMCSHRVLIYGVPLKANIEEFSVAFQQEESCVYLAEGVLYEMRCYKKR